MRIGKYVILLIAIISAIACAEVKEEWVTRYNGSGNGRDRPSTLVLDASGNAYVTGISMNPDSTFDYVTVKYNPDGGEEWSVVYDGEGHPWYDEITSGVDSFGNVYVSGRCQNPDSGDEDNFDYATIKYTPQGKVEWIARYNGSGNGKDEPIAQAVDASGNVYVIGDSEGHNSEAEICTVKYNTLGEEQWVVRYNGSEEKTSQRVKAIAVDASGNVYVTGRTSDNSLDCTPDPLEYYYTTVKYNPQGSMLWVAHYNAVGNSIFEEPSGLGVDTHGNVYVTGRYENRDSAKFYFLTVKYDSNGKVQWSARYSCPAQVGVDEKVLLAVDAEGNVYVSGRGKNQEPERKGDYAYTTIKYNSQGQEVWVARYNGPGNYWDAPTAIAVDCSGGIYVTGHSVGENLIMYFVTIKYDPQGMEEWIALLKGSQNRQHTPIALEVNEKGDVYVTGYTKNNESGDDYITIKYSQR